MKQGDAKPQISVIVTTYNWPAALALVLQGLARQSLTNFEVIVADDGSTDSTSQLITQLRPELPYSLQHVWQPDAGFRAAMIRNKAVAQAKGEYLVFLDGDCLPRRTFLANHFKLAETGWLVAGNRLLLNQDFTAQVVSQQLPVDQWPLYAWLKHRWLRDCNRLLPLLSLPLGPLRKLKATNWHGVKTCNLGLWRHDFISVNGFDEAYQGWGYEDSDLVIRLLRLGIRRKQGQFAVPVIHLWHPENDRAQHAANLARLQQTTAAKSLTVIQGISQYL